MSLRFSPPSRRLLPASPLGLPATRGCRLPPQRSTGQPSPGCSGPLKVNETHSSAAGVGVRERCAPRIRLCDHRGTDPPLGTGTPMKLWPCRRCRATDALTRMSKHVQVRYDIDTVTGQVRQTEQLAVAPELATALQAAEDERANAYIAHQRADSATTGHGAGNHPRSTRRSITAAAAKMTMTDSRHASSSWSSWCIDVSPTWVSRAHSAATFALRPMLLGKGFGDMGTTVKDFGPIQ